MNFQNIYTFIYQKTLLHTLLLLDFKIAESLQCILKHYEFLKFIKNPKIKPTKTCILNLCLYL